MLNMDIVTAFARLYKAGSGRDKENRYCESRDRRLPMDMENLEDLYKSFDPSKLNASFRAKWQQGSRCPGIHGTNVSVLGAIYCPMPFEPNSYSKCCQVDTAEIEYKCCPPSLDAHSVIAKWGIGFGVIVSCFLVILCTVFSFNKCTRICHSNDSDAPPRPKLRLSVIKQTILPIDKRTLLKTGNYTVEQSWDQVVVKFYNREFYEQFRDLLIRKYKTLNWKDPRKAQEGSITNNAGSPVTLSMNEDCRAIGVTNEGSISWIMNDFQNICKNVHIPGDYNVKISQTEVEIKFVIVSLFDKFKRALLFRYPTLPWSKYLQRDCTQIALSNGKNVTIHLWEDVHSIWLSGDGKKDWYNQEFQEIYADAVCGKMKENEGKKCGSRPNSATSRRSSKARNTPLSRASSQVEIPANYTVKTLDAGGYEIEFPNSDYVSEIKLLLSESNTNAVKWTRYSRRHVANVNVDANKTVAIHMGSTTEQPRKIWIYNEPACKEWFNGEFKDLYARAFENMHKIPTDSASKEISQKTRSDSDEVTK